MPTDIRPLFVYGDRANTEILTAAADLTDAQLDERFDMGFGTLRRSLIHIVGGERVWLARWQGHANTPWPDHKAATSVTELRDWLSAHIPARDAFLDALTSADLDQHVEYMDSMGGIFTASLRDMLLQGAVHSIHHRAQAVNMLRRLDSPAEDMDYMVHVRQPTDK